MDRQFVVRDGGGDLVDLALERVVVERVDRRMQRIDQKQPDHRMRRYQVDLEFGAGGNLAGVLERPEHGIRLLGDVRIEQIAEMHVLDAQSRLERETLAAGTAAGVHAEKLARFHKCRVIGKHRLEPGDPVAALAGFAVRQPLDARTQRCAHLREDVLRIRHRHAADEVDVAGHCRCTFVLRRYCGSTFNSLPSARHWACSLPMV